MNQTLKEQIDRAIRDDIDLTVFFKNGKIAFTDILDYMTSIPKSAYICEIDVSFLEENKVYTVYDQVKVRIIEELCN